MVALDIVRASNRSLKSRIPGITALFVGGTSGIGRSTLLQLAHHAHEPKAYIVGRNAANASPLLSELRKINPSGEFKFIEADVSLISNVDKACAELKRDVKALDLVFMTPGGISLSGRRETPEHIDHLFALRYYSRMRFIQQLSPLLRESPLSRVVSVFGGGFEYGLKRDDLDLKRNYSILNCALNSVTMTTLSMEHLAQVPENENLNFIHLYPGLVGTNIYTNSFPAPIAALYNYGMWPFMWPFSVNLRESGERNLYLATSERYARRTGNSTRGVSTDRVDAAIGSEGRSGSGVYLANWKGETSVGGKILQTLRSQDVAREVWQHTEALIDAAPRS